MARVRGIPLALVNADAALLLSNKTLAPIAQRVLFGFPADFGRAAGKAVVTGNPVRKEILEMTSPQQRFEGRDGVLRILVVGGSLGAKVLNDCIPAALALMPEATRPQVTHQSGKKNIDALRESYKQAGVQAEVVDFIDDMAAAYAKADLVICRAGAITVAELTAAGVASVLVPFPHAVDDHQTHNARFLSDKSAAVLLPQNEPTPRKFADLLLGFTRERLLEMARLARSLGKPDATRAVAEHCMAAAG
jgi:UDP-N-acetylglucosamine--N-acetylmuramyl-(pentapeptide) pyrophosphoryl-undecaprenol N-acetylglucosamine transferase